VHFALAVLVATICLGYLDGRTFNVNSRRPQYREVDGSVAYVTFYAPLQSDITTAVSLAATITRVAGGWWATDYIWRSAFVAMERGGISAKGLSQAISNRPPAPRHFTRRSNMVIIYIALFATFAIDYFSAALTGSFIWEAANTRIPGRIPLTGIANGTEQDSGMSAAEMWESFGLEPPEQRQAVAMGFAYAMVAWGIPQSDSDLHVTEPSSTIRRVIQGSQYIPTNSTLTKITMPYFALDDFEWVRDPHQVLTDRQISLLTPTYDGYNPFVTNGTGGLLPDVEWGTGPMLQTTDLYVSESRLFAFLINFDYDHHYDVGWPSSCPQNYTIDPGSQINLFTLPGNNSNDALALETITCFAIANMSYRAGVTSCRNCQVISPNIVEAQAPFSLLGDAYTSEALGMVPFLGSQLLLSNYTIPLNYGTRRNMVIELTSRMYQAAWAAISDLFSANIDTTTVQIALPTLRAKVIHWRVYLWVVLHLWVLALGLLFTYFQSYCDHPWVEDPTMAVFWLDTRAALTDSEGQGVLDPWQPGTKIHEGGMLILEHNEAGQRSVQVKRSSGSHQRRYLDSIPLRRRRPPSSSTILGEEGRQSVETFIDFHSDKYAD
jgi:hypothetical protein